MRYTESSVDGHAKRFSRFVRRSRPRRTGAIRWEEIDCDAVFTEVSDTFATDKLIRVQHTFYYACKPPRSDSLGAWRFRQVPEDLQNAIDKARAFCCLRFECAETWNDWAARFSVSDVRWIGLKPAQPGLVQALTSIPRLPPHEYCGASLSVSMRSRTHSLNAKNTRTVMPTVNPQPTTNPERS